MGDEPTGDDLNKAMFMNLVMMFGATAMQQLGKLVNPITQKTEVSLEGAQSSIDMLTMLDAKTKGNLDREEDRLLKQTISTLQMNYVETAQSAGAAPNEDTAKQEEDAGASAEAAQTPGDEKKDSGGDRKEPKFRKKYD